MSIDKNLAARDAADAWAAAQIKARPYLADSITRQAVAALAGFVTGARVRRDATDALIAITKGVAAKQRYENDPARKVERDLAAIRTAEAAAHAEAPAETEEEALQAMYNRLGNRPPETQNSAANA